MYTPLDDDDNDSNNNNAFGLLNQPIFPQMTPGWIMSSKVYKGALGIVEVQAGCPSWGPINTVTELKGCSVTHGSLSAVTHAPFHVTM